MGRVITKIQGAGYMVWQARHMAYHVMLGLLWAWVLREAWGQFNPRWIWTAVIGSLLPDIDHLFYFFGYGKKDAYTQTAVRYVKKRQWRALFYFFSNSHKTNTNLSYHNIYVVVILIGVAYLASFFDWQTGVVLFGAMVGHFVFDIADDLVLLGELNDNWRRWGRPK